MELNLSPKVSIDNLKETNLITSLRHIASEVRRSMVIEFCGEDDMTGECEQASIIMWKYINDIKLIEPNQSEQLPTQIWLRLNLDGASFLKTFKARSPALAHL